MLKKGFIIFIGLLSTVQAQNYNNAQTLFTIANDNVNVGEFVRVYTKNNINNQADFSKASLEEYLSLYQNFRLKVKEAESLGMDTVKTFKNELASYRRQLTPSYLSDRESTDKLVNEAYLRMKEEVEVSHILIFWPNTKPNKADSIKVLREIEKIRKSAQNTSFETQVAKYNKSNTQKYPNNKQKYESGALGYVSVFQTVYPFENAMYTTNVGEISKPVATRFGFHIVYVKNKRPARGKMETAHILVKSKETDSPENKKKALEKANLIYADINSGKMSFEDAVKQFSEDKRTKFQQGKLPKLSGSEMLTPYSDAVFALNKDGDITKPVKTKIGWHIIKRISKEELPSLDMARSDIQKRVKKDSRSNVANEKMIADTKAKFVFVENSFAKNEIIDALNRNRKVEKSDIYNKPLFTIGEERVTQNQFISYVSTSRNKAPKAKQGFYEEKYKNFKEQKITSYREAHLEEIVDEFKFLMQEYHDGILLFELTNKEVWNKAVEDTTGLKNFFAENRAKYMWKQRLDYTTYIAKNEKSASKLKKFLIKGKNAAFVDKKLNKKEENVSIKVDFVEKESNETSKALKAEKGFMLEEKNLDGSVKMVYVYDVVAPMKKELAETRGYVISDYQDFLEKQWIQALSNKYPIKVDYKVFESLIK